MWRYHVGTLRDSCSKDLRGRCTKALRKSHTSRKGLVNFDCQDESESLFENDPRFAEVTVVG